MSGIKELIRTEENGTLSFGDYELAQKAKRSDYEHEGDLYKIKTYAEITKLEKNGMFAYESVPSIWKTHIRNSGRKILFLLLSFTASQPLPEHWHHLRQFPR